MTTINFGNQDINVQVSGLSGPPSASLVSLQSGGTVEDVLKSTFVFTPATPQATINAALDVNDATCIWQAGSYSLANLSGTGARQRHTCPTGIAHIFKNANGPIWEHSGSDLTLDGIVFHGEAATYTGVNFKHTGTATLYRYGSRDADQEAIISEERVRAFGAVDVVQSDNAAYDWIVGKSGTAVLYSYIEAPYTSQATGGIRTIDTGSTVIVGGQIGKLWVSAGTNPPGSNGGHISNVRVTGATQIDVPNTIMTGCACAENVTIGVGVSGCTIVVNLSAGKKVINNGNLGNNIQELDSDASGVLQINYGGKDKATSLKVIPDAADGIFELTQELILPYNRAYKTRDSAGTGTVNVAQVFDANGSIQFGSALTPGQAIVLFAGGSSGVLSFVGGNLKMSVLSSSVNLASGVVYAINGQQVVGPRGAAVADATDAASAITQLNALLARCRDHGLIAT